MRLGVLLLLLASMAPAIAQPTPDDVRTAEAAMVRGNEAEARGDDVAALAAYLEAQRLAPNANVPHKLAGEALERLARYPEALASYRRYLEISPNGKSAGEIRERIDRIEREKVGTLSFTCPATAQIAFDGGALEPAPVAPRIVNASRTYKVRIESAGYKPVDTEVSARAGERVEVPCALTPIRLEVIHPPEVTPRDPVVDTGRERSWYRRPIVIGPIIGGAVAIVSIALYLTFADGVPDSDGGTHSLP